MCRERREKIYVMFTIDLVRYPKVIFIPSCSIDISRPPKKKTVKIPINEFVARYCYYRCPSNYRIMSMVGILLCSFWQISTLLFLQSLKFVLFIYSFISKIASSVFHQALPQCKKSTKPKYVCFWGARVSPQAKTGRRNPTKLNIQNLPKEKSFNGNTEKRAKSIQSMKKTQCK